MGSPDIAILLDAVTRQKAMRHAERSFHEFVRQAWPVIEPGVPYVDGWHVGVIADHLEAVTEGEIRRLLINIPPRHFKSGLVSVLWPVWEWIKRPEEKYLCASYSSVLSIRDALKSRRLITSPWFQERWGDRFCLTGDQNAKQRYENDKTGYRIATSVGGATTGDGGSRLLLDDPHGAQDAQSDALRGSTIEWLDMVWSTRLNNPRTDAMITIMQRLHDRDASGHLLERGGWEHVCLPAEFDGKRRKTILGPYDERKKEGELLWPEQFTPEVLDQLKLQLGTYGSSGQLQQDPAPSGSGILDTTCLQLWPTDQPIPAFTFVLPSYDCAFTEKTSGDPTACVVFGCFTNKQKRCVMIVDAWSEHLSYPDLRERAVQDWHATYGGSLSDPTRSKPRKPDAVLIEAKASGQSLIQDLRAANVPAIPYNPGNADKISRAHQVAPIIELDCIYIPESKKFPGQFVTWALDFIKQCQRFPVAEHDDYVDCLTQGLIYLRDKGMFDLAKAKEDVIEERDYRAERKRRANPYAQ